MINFTRGPWELRNNLRIFSTREARFGTQTLIASVNGGRVNGGFGDANARLITRVPEMYLLLQRAKQALEVAETHLGVSDVLPDIDALLEKLDA